MAQFIQHNAPAGRTYSSIRHAGEEILATHCQRFPQNPQRTCFILPIMFKSTHPENVIQNTAGLSEREKKSLTGLNINIRGERGEYEVYKAFSSLVRQSSAESILVLYGYKLDNDNGKNLKTHAIINELPTINLSRVNMKREHDFVIIVRYIGIVLCEVKSSGSAENIESAESQLHNSKTFVQQIFLAIAGPSSPQLPIVKVIIVPHEASTPSTPKKHNDCHIIYQDDLQNFDAKWTQIVRELSIITRTCTIPLSTFEHLVQFLVGVWTMHPITQHNYDFDNTGASLSSNVTLIDSSVNRAEFAVTKQAQRLCSDVASSLNEILQRSDEFHIMYLSPDQKMLFDNYRHALIHSHAGTGKTMLILLKIIELLENDPTQKILLAAPRIHHLRCQQILTNHKINTKIATEFAFTKRGRGTSETPPPLLGCGVLIITIKNFFRVKRETLMQYDISKFNVFVDDLHSHIVQEQKNKNDSWDRGSLDRGLLDVIDQPAFDDGDGDSENDSGNENAEDNICTFSDIAEFIDNTYDLLNTTEQYAWFGFDVVQQPSYYDKKKRSDRLFMTSHGSTRAFSIPIVTMTSVLRCTTEVTDVVDEARQTQFHFNELDNNHVIKEIGCGHHITTGKRVLYEKLQQNTDKKFRERFICDRVSALLCNFSRTTSPQPNKDPFSSVAILFENFYELKKYKPSVELMLRQQFKVGCQTIKEQITNKNEYDVIVDHSKNVQSFESPTVVYVRTHYVFAGSGQVLYNLISRARTQCAVVDVATTLPPLSLKHIDLVVWEEMNGNFTKK